MKQEFFEKERQFFFHTYKRLTLDIDRGEGCYLIARDGKRYLDFFGGLAVNALGYNNPKVNNAIQQQIQKYIHLSNYYVQESQVKLAERLLQVSGYKRLFFSNSGTEAIEGALKLARKWGKAKNKNEVLGLSNSFHGRTMGALSLTERPKYREGYEPFLQGVSHLPFSDVEALRNNVNEKTLAVFLEVIQGEGGINVITQEFADELRLLQKKFGFLVVADEIQSGVGRTGKFFGFEHFRLRPDIVVVAKALGGGLPLGCFMGNDRVEEVLSYGAHGTTFGGNPVACAAGKVVLDEILERDLMKRAYEIGETIKAGAHKIKQDLPGVIREVRGFGCMLGIELTFDGQPVVDEMQKRGVLINCTNTNVLRLLPPYIVQPEHCDILLHELREVLSSFPKK